jgi:hypothetical protein
MQVLYRSITVGLLLGLVAAADWPQFRGPGGLGVAAKETGLPIEWDDQTNLAWKVELPGPGSSSPIVVGDRVLVTCYSGYGTGAGGDPSALRRHLHCFDRGGKLLWKKDVAAAGKEAPYSGPYITKHGYASSTPASDGKSVYVYFGTTGVIAYDLNGKERWHQSVGSSTDGWGSGSSPVIYKDLVIVNAGIEGGALIALARDTGKPVWVAKGLGRTWSTPAIVEVAGRQELVVYLPSEVCGYDPDKGTKRWSCPGTEDFYVVPEVVADRGIVYAIGGRDNVALAVKAGGMGEVKPIWRITKGSNVSSPLLLDGYLYYAHESGGIIYCVKAADGTVQYTQRLNPPTDLIYASATAGDGKIYYVSRSDGVYVLEASPKYKLLAHNQFKNDTSVFNASPAIADGRLYLRSDRYVYCIGKVR